MIGSSPYEIQQEHSLADLKIDGVRRRGLTISEMVLAFAILIIAVISVASFVVTVYRSVKEGKFQSVGSSLAQSELERLRNDAEALTELTQNAATGVSDKTVDIDQVPIRFHQVIMAQPVGSMGNRYLQVVATVEWEQNGRQRRVRLETCFPRPE